MKQTSTYKTYQECKDNHPNDDVWYDDFHKCYQNTAYKGCSLGNITECNPDDYKLETMKITYEELQDLYNYHWRHTYQSGATYFRRREVFKKMADDLNKKYNIEEK